jgi:hypothetical protein
VVSVVPVDFTRESFKCFIPRYITKNRAHQNGQFWSVSPRKGSCPLKKFFVFLHRCSPPPNLSTKWKRMNLIFRMTWFKFILTDIATGENDQNLYTTLRGSGPHSWSPGSDIFYRLPLHLFSTDLELLLILKTLLSLTK